ncbi:MAG: glycosyltransferase family 9 protein [Gemmatimonadaceae bacterium]
MPRRVSSLFRTLDRAIGTPLVAAFALAPKRRHPEPDTIRRIGVLKTAAIGDTLLLSGVLPAIRRRYPRAAVVLVTGIDNAQAATLLGDLVDERIAIRPTAPGSALSAIRGLRLDVLLECGPWPRIDALLAALSGARYRVGFRVAGHARHFGFDRVVDHSSTIHQFQNLQNLAAAIGVTEFEAPSLRPPGAVAASRAPARGYAILHPWSGGYMGHVKEWPSERWVELACQLHARFGLRALITGTAADRHRSRALADSMSRSGCAASSIAGEFSLVELADVLAASDLVVSVNTGIMHLAALLGVATVSLEGPVAIHRWGPVGPRVRSVASTLPGCGYLDLGFEYDGQRLDCMNGVQVGAVLTAVDDLRRSNVSPSSARR